MVNKKKKKTLKLQQYKRLPKYDGISNPTGYLEDSANMFTPSKNYDSLAINNKAINEQQFGPGLSSTPKSSTLDLNTNTNNNNSSVNLNNNTAGMVAQIAASFVGDQSEHPEYGNYDSIAADTMSNYGVIGQVAGAAGEVGGKLLKPNYDEYGNATSESQEQLYYQAGAYFDPLGAAESQDSFGEGVVAALLPGWGGENTRKKEAADAKDRKNKAIAQKNQAGLDQLNQGIVATSGAERYFAKYGGKLPRMAIGGPIEENVPRDAFGNIKSGSGNWQEAYYTSNIERPRTKSNTINTLVNEFDFDRETANARYSPELLDSIAGTTDKYKYATSSTGNPVLNEMYSNKAARTQIFEQGGGLNNINNSNPVIRQYKGETHDNGVNGGIEVGSDGNPTSITGKKGIALVENDEVAFDGYIFSNSIEYK